MKFRVWELGHSHFRGTKIGTVRTFIDRNGRPHALPYETRPVGIPLSFQPALDRCPARAGSVGFCAASAKRRPDSFVPPQYAPRRRDRWSMGLGPRGNRARRARPCPGAARFGRRSS